MKNIFALLFLLAAATVQAQQPFAKMVVGLETGWDLLLYDEGRKPHVIPNIHVEYPFGDVSIGFGFAYKGFETARYEYYTGERRGGLSGEQKTLFHVIENRSVRPSYFSVPLRFSYRLLPCKCVYAYGGVSLDFLNPKTTVTDEGDQLWETKPGAIRTESGFFKQNLRTYEVGVGFKLHTSDYFRLVARPSYVWTENPEVSGPAVIRSLRMTFGMQYAFVGYK